MRRVALGVRDVVHIAVGGVPVRGRIVVGVDHLCEQAPLVVSRDGVVALGVRDDVRVLALRVTKLKSVILLAILLLA